MIVEADSIEEAVQVAQESPGVMMPGSSVEVIRRIQPAGSPALYEDRVGDNHHHVICRTCGKTVDVDCAVGDTPCLTAAADSG